MLLASFWWCGSAAAIEVAGELFVDINAATFTTGDATWSNAGTYVDFQTVGGPVSTMIGTAPAIAFDGTNDAFQALGLEEAPDGLIGLEPTRTIEAWVYNDLIASEETIVAWGTRSDPAGSNMAFNYGNHGMYGAVGHWGGGQHDVGWIDNDFTAGAPERQQWHHLVYTHDGEVTRLYADGELWNEEETLELWGPLDTEPTPIAIASQWDADGTTLTAGLRGSLAIGQIRIHDGVLSEGQVIANYQEELPGYGNPVVDPIVPEPIPFAPLHRYSFDSTATGDAEGVEITDSIGGAHGIVVGEGASFDNGTLQLTGGTSDFAAYGDLPNGLISGLTDVTIEAWASVNSAQGWSRIFDFGSTAPGGEAGELEEPGGGGEGLDYLFLSAEIGTDTLNQRVEIRNEDPAGGGMTTVDFANPTGGSGELTHFAVVYNSEGADDTATISVYVDGELQNESTTAIALSDINDVNNWLGRSNWTADSNLDGSYDEFRIYDYALTNNQVLGNSDAGANVVNLDGGGIPGDFNGDNELDAADIDELSAAARNGDNSAIYDLNEDGTVDGADRTVWIADLKQVWVGDADLNGVFDSTDIVAVFTVGEYEDGIAGNSTWAEGDWDGNGDFNSGDIVAAFTEGGYNQGPRAATSAVPEPGSLVLLLTAMLGFSLRRRK